MYCAFSCVWYMRRLDHRKHREARGMTRSLARSFAHSLAYHDTQPAHTTHRTHTQKKETKSSVKWFIFCNFANGFYLCLWYKPNQFIYTHLHSLLTPYPFPHFLSPPFSPPFSIYRRFFGAFYNKVLIPYFSTFGPARAGFWICCRVAEPT